MSLTDSGPIAPIGRRVVALLIDSAIGGVLALGTAVTMTLILGVPQVSVSASPDAVAAALVQALIVVYGAVAAVGVVWWLVVSVLQGGAGSLGMRVMGLRLVQADTAAPVGFGRALLRNVVFGVTGAIVVGYFSPLFDGSGRAQGWHDKAANALMVDSRAAAAPSAAVPVAGGAPAVAPDAASYPANPGGYPGVPGVSAAGSPFNGHPVSPSLPGPPPLVPVPTLMPEPTAQPPATPSPFVSPVVNAPEPESAGFPDATVAGNFAGGEVSEPEVITVVPGFASPVAAPPVAASPPVTGPAGAFASESSTKLPIEQPTAPPTAPTPTPSTDAVVQNDAYEEDLEATRMSIPGHRLLFVWDDGTRVSVSRRAVFGRNPVAEGDAVLIPVRDETLSLSKTHFEASAEASGGWVMDRHSTNGMTVVRDGVRIACPPGERVQVRLGDAIEIGDRIVTVGGYA